MVPATYLFAMRIIMASGRDPLFQLDDEEALFALHFAWGARFLRAIFLWFHKETPFLFWSAGDEASIPCGQTDRQESDEAVSIVPGAASHQPAKCRPNSSFQLEPNCWSKSFMVFHPGRGPN